MIYIENNYTEPSHTLNSSQTAYGRDDLVNILNGRRSGDTHRAYCPNCNPHGHNHPNKRALIIFDDGGLYCHRCHCGKRDLIPLIFGAGATYRADRPHRTKHDRKPRNPKRYGDSRQIEDFYDYTDRRGERIYQKVRYKQHGMINGRYRPKYVIRHQDEDGEWYYGKPEGADVLYNLPDVRCHQAKNVIIVEGEKDADRVNAELRTMGLYGEWVATCGANGTQWTNEYTYSLHYAHNILIIPDNDETGRNYAQTVADATNRTGGRTTVKIITLPDLLEGGDISDYLDKDGRTLKGILSWAEIVEPIAKPEWESPYRTTAHQDTTNTPTRHVNRKAETCDCDYCQCEKGAAVTFYEGHTFVSQLGSAPMHVCKRRLHHEAIRWAYQIEDEQYTETIYMRRMRGNTYKRWNNRNRQNKKRGNDYHRYRPIHLSCGDVVLISTDKTDGTLLPDDLTELYDIIYPLLKESDPNKRNRGTADWGGDYQGSKGNGKRKAKIRKYGDKTKGKCATYLSRLSPIAIAKRLRIKSKSKRRFKIDGEPHETYKKMVDAGIDLRLPHTQKGAIDIWAVAGHFDEPNEDTVTDKGDRETKESISLKRDIEPMSEDEIDQLIPTQSRFPNDLL